MDAQKTAFFLLIALLPVATESKAPEGHRVVRITDYEKEVSYVADSVKGPKDQMRDKITEIKNMLDEVSALAEICGACDSNPCLNGGTCFDETNGKYSCHCAEGWKGDQCEKCHTALGMESGKIKDEQITASTHEYSRQPSLGRLNYDVSQGTPGSWSSSVKDKNQWLQIDLSSGNRNVSGIATQGGTNFRENKGWVKTFNLQYSDDGVNFEWYKGGEATEMVFAANKDEDTVVYHDLSQPITSRYIRVLPKSWRKVISMRVELYGCQEIKPCDSSPCLNGGNCTNEADGNYTCQCPSGWMGDTCQEKSAKGLEKSAIIGDNRKYLAKLTEWLKPVSMSGGQWKLCWRSSEHGWASSTFHAMCDRKGSTVTIIKANDNIFGGYTSISWGGSGRYLNDPNAFLFSLANKVKIPPCKLAQPNTGSPHSIYTDTGYGPTFGGGHDLHVANGANANTNSYTNLGHTYSTPPSGVKANEFLAGAYNFKPSEIETFYYQK